MGRAALQTRREAGGTPQDEWVERHSRGEGRRAALSSLLGGAARLPRQVISTQIIKPMKRLRSLKGGNAPSRRRPEGGAADAITGRNYGRWERRETGWEKLALGFSGKQIV